MVEKNEIEIILWIFLSQNFRKFIVYSPLKYDLHVLKSLKLIFQYFFFNVNLFLLSEPHQRVKPLLTVIDWKLEMLK